MKKYLLYIICLLYVKANCQVINQNKYYSINSQNGMCLQLNSTNNETTISQAKPTNTTSQLWKFKQKGNHFLIVSKLDENKAITLDDGKFIVIYDITEGVDQLFEILETENEVNTITMFSTVSNLPLATKQNDAIGSKIIEAPNLDLNSAGLQQYWIVKEELPKVKSITTRPVASKNVVPVRNTDFNSANNNTNSTNNLTSNYYTINSKHSGLPLNIRDQGTQTGLDLYQDGDKGVRPAGKFKFIPLGNNEFNIVVLNSGKYLQGGNNEGDGITLQNKSSDIKQIFILKNIAGNDFKFVLKHSNRVFAVEANSTWHGTTMREYPEVNGSNEVFTITREKSIVFEETIQKAKNFISEKQNEQAIIELDKAIAIYPNDGYGYAQKAEVLQYSLHKTADASFNYEVAFNNGYKPLSMILQWGDCLWGSRVEDLVKVQQKCIDEGTYQLTQNKTNEEKEYIKSKMIVAFGNMACGYVNLGIFDKAQQAINNGYAIDPNTDNVNLGFAGGEINQIKGGQAWKEKRYNEAENFMKSALVCYTKGKNSKRIEQANRILEMLQQSLPYRNVTPVNTIKILSMHVSAIDINQILNGKQVNVKDVMLEGTIQRNYAGQGWFMLQNLIYTKGQLAFDFKNVKVGTATSLWDGHPQVEPSSIKPSVAPLLFEHQNYDDFIFYWNGFTNGLNQGTGVGIYSWPLSLGGFDFGTVRGYSIMATNPEMYGIQDGLLHHEFGHLMEAHSEIGWVHCEDVLKTDKDKPVYDSWDKNCDHIEEWFYSEAIKNKYDKMNWRIEYPTKITQAQLDAMMLKNSADRKSKNTQAPAEALKENR